MIYNLAGHITVRAKRTGKRAAVEQDIEAVLMDGCMYLANKYQGLQFDTSALSINQQLSERLK